MGSEKFSPLPRNDEYKRRVLSAPYEICIERAKYVTESFQKTEGEHPAVWHQVRQDLTREPFGSPLAELGEFA